MRIVSVRRRLAIKRPTPSMVGCRMSKAGQRATGAVIFMLDLARHISCHVGRHCIGSAVMIKHLITMAVVDGTRVVLVSLCTLDSLFLLRSHHCLGRQTVVMTMASIYRSCGVAVACVVAKHRAGTAVLS